jgi:copper chaperone
MLTFEVNDMTCGHCVSSITKAVKAVDQDAKVTADLAHKRVTIEDAHTNAQALTAAMTDAGFTPVQIQANA